MTAKILRQNLISTLLPMLLSVLVLSVLSIALIFRYTENDLQRSNVNTLNSMQYNVELIMRDLDQYIYIFSSNPTIISRTKAILSSTHYTYAEHQSVLFINNAVDTPVNTNPYLHSAYVYYYGYSKLLCSDIGLTKLEGFYDTDWLEKLALPVKQQRLFERRQIKRYAFEKEPTVVLTLNRALRSPGTSGGDGLVTLNLDADYVTSLLRGMVRYEGQILLVADEMGRIVLSNGGDKPRTDIAALRQPGGLLATGSYRCYESASSQYGLSFYSLVPTRAGYLLTMQLMVTTLISVLAVGCVGSLIAVSTTRRIRAQLLSIVDTLAQYEKTGEYADTVSRTGNIYDYIVLNVLNMAMSGNRMRLQLAERKYQMDLYELKALQAQINPHFLFNTLETINWKIMELAGAHTLANEMIENLSAILKYCLSNPEEKTTLRQEIDFTRRYMSIQNIRYKNQYSILWDYQDVLLDISVMKLLFQPLLENSMKHGGLSRSRSVDIKIRICRRGDRLHFLIKDNGVGMNEERLAQVRANLQEKWHYDEHIGLVNINQRIRLLYGEGSGLRIYSKENWGTVIYFAFPLHEKNQETGA